MTANYSQDEQLITLTKRVDEQESVIQKILNWIKSIFGVSL